MLFMHQRLKQFEISVGVHMNWIILGQMTLLKYHHDPWFKLTNSMHVICSPKTMELHKISAFGAPTHVNRQTRPGKVKRLTMAQSNYQEQING